MQVMTEQASSAGLFDDGYMGYVAVALYGPEREVAANFTGPLPDLEEGAELRLIATPAGVRIECGGAYAVMPPPVAGALARHILYLADLSAALGRSGMPPKPPKGKNV